MVRALLLLMTPEQRRELRKELDTIEEEIKTDEIKTADVRMPEGTHAADIERVREALRRRGVA